MTNLFLFTGEETFLLHQQIQSWKEAFRKKYGDDMNLVTLDANAVEEAEIIRQAETFPFLADKRLIFIENLPEAARVSKKGKGKDDEDEEEEEPRGSESKMIDFLEKIPETSVVVFIQPKPDKRKSLYKKIVHLSTLAQGDNKTARNDKSRSKDGKVEMVAEIKEFKPLKDATLVKWIQTQAQVYGARMGTSCADHLAVHCGSDLWRLDQEIKKLSAFADGKPITAEMVEELVTPSLEANIFRLTDALGAKDQKGAIANLHQALAAGESLQMVFYMIVRQFRLLLMVSAAASNERTANPIAIAATLKLHPFVAKNTLSQAKRFKLPELKSAYRKLLEIDTALKTGKIQMSTDNQDELALAIEKFMLEFCR